MAKKLSEKEEKINLKLLLLKTRAKRKELDKKATQKTLRK